MMEQFPLPAYQPNEPSPSEEKVLTYPPKFVKPEEQVSNVWLRSISSLAAYLVLGYLIFHSFSLLLIITVIVVIHELGHFLAMKAYRYKDLGIFFIPLLGAYVSGSKREVSQKESAVILFAGPLPGIILGSIFYLVWNMNQDIYFQGHSLETIGLFFI